MCGDQKEGWTLDSMKERDAEMKRKRECLDGDTGKKREREREKERERILHSREEIECRDCLLIIFLCWFSYIYTLFNNINIIFILYNIHIISYL